MSKPTERPNLTSAALAVAAFRSAVAAFANGGQDEAASEEYLAELRERYADRTDDDARVVLVLLDEIDVLDDALSDSEDEVERLLAEVKRLRAKAAPKAPSASISRTKSGKWAVRWREGDGQRSQSFTRRQHAEDFRAAMRGRWNGGAS
ncbi:hypothetical protein ACPC54_17790 [Kitasatospora sp. NPDC094028]